MLMNMSQLNPVVTRWMYSFLLTNTNNYKGSNSIEDPKVPHSKNNMVKKESHAVKTQEYQYPFKEKLKYWDTQKLNTSQSYFTRERGKDIDKYSNAGSTDDGQHHIIMEGQS